MKKIKYVVEICIEVLQAVLPFIKNRKASANGRKRRKSADTATE